MSQQQPIPARRPSVSASDPPSFIPIPANTRGIPPSSYGPTSPSATLSTSPRATFTDRGSFGTSPGSHSRTRSASGVVNSIARTLTAFLPPDYPLAEEPEGAATPKRQGKQKILLLENINLDAANYLKQAGFEVDHFTKAFSEEELIAKLPAYNAIGIRSKTKMTKKVIEACSNLVAIGCFCIGTNQVDLLAAAQNGIAVFNSPFANSRSVAELVISEVIALSRQLVDRTAELRAGIWNKVSKGCWEVRGKTLGIIGYGHIGSQLSVLAESLGMSVIYYDVIPIMPLGTARQVETLTDLLGKADFVTLHVPEIPDTINMIGAQELAAMKKGAYLINNARGKVVDLGALADALESEHLAGAAIDVFPKEPGSNGPGFNGDLGDFIPRLRKVPNLIMTPHIGGSTEEAQRAIGSEVSTALLRYIESGTTIGAVNFPEVDLRAITIEDDRHIRVCHVHKNEPGVLKRVNNILADHNIVKQFSDSKGDIAYLMADISDVGEEEVENIYKQISGHSTNIFTRLLY
ncbi:putative d-3-phosphoglycerate dehydrogenase 2 [Papiliotrema laurentii]|uniref:phosphoglycerate dehydrogenase n=1 Tax=Papiliotrema laurentii TaxID=5418 RepID=A0AAD9D1G9_PAPLA|nr:putative d-3-phosphoglycerate dehydrogenase 2 [Papiliotrema laurentii]